MSLLAHTGWFDDLNIEDPIEDDFDEFGIVDSDDLDDEDYDLEDDDLDELI